MRRSVRGCCRGWRRCSGGLTSHRRGRRTRATSCSPPGGCSWSGWGGGARAAGGCVLVVEDVQWADDGLLDFFETLVESAQAPIFILTFARSELAERRPHWGCHRRTHVLHLEPMTDAAMSDLVDGLVDGLPADTRAQLVARADGVPLYAVETVRALIDRDAVVPREGRYVLADDAT